MKTRSLATVLGLVFALSGFAAIDSITHAQEQPTTPSIVGQWALMDRANAEERRDAAIEEAIGDIVFIGRPIARRRMRNELPIHERVTFTETANGLRAQVGPYDFTTPSDGTIHPIQDPWDNDVRVSQRIQGPRLTQVFRAENGVLYHQFQLAPNGNRLVLNIRVTSPRLPAEARYRFVFRRLR